ncbi:MAG: nucleotidyltransferase domain-containing protein [Symbiobacterium sp.]|uniref:nucleotidyltransferase domain-containing protein n=1 Tax=Symbiobacterium sp. TaxID=1971213 RepID=UPI003464C255
MPQSKVIAALSAVRGVEAIALGGSHSRGEAGPQSDYDFGLYYRAGALDLEALDRALTALDDGHRTGLLHPPGDWGPWINGGAWLTVDGVPVDILLREIGKVEETLRDCLAGRVTVDFQSGHPFGFVNTIYAAETHYGKPLWQSPAAPLDRLKALLYAEGPYPPRMREATVRRFLWEAWFALACARKAAHKGDFHYAEGSLFRAVGAWVQVLYALNNRYLMNEKGALGRVRELERRPAEMESRVRQAYRLLADGAAADAYEILDALHGEIQGLAQEFEPVQTEIR